MQGTSIGKFLLFGNGSFLSSNKEREKSRKEIKFLHFGCCLVCSFDDLDIPAAGNQSSSSSSSFCLLTPYRSYHWPCDEIALLTELGRQGYSNGHRQDDDVCQSSSTK
jgi:hypothetical protein